MKDFVNLLWKPLKLDIDTFVAQRNSPDAFKRAVLVVVVVGLFVGVFAGGVVFGGALLTPEPPTTVAEFLEQIPEPMRPMVEDLLSNPDFRAGLGLVVDIQQVIMADRGKFLAGKFFDALSLWITSPIGFLAAIVPFTLLVLLVARLLGGNASLSGMLGCTLLAVTPHLLDPIGIVLGAIPLCGPCLSGIVGLITFIWSIVIYVVAVAVASGFSYAKSIAAILISFALAVLGPTLLLIVFMIVMFLVGSIAGAGSS